MHESEQKRPTAQPIVSAVLDDGTIIEMGYRPETRAAVLLTWQAGQVEEVDSIDVPGVGRLVPFSSQNNLLAHNVVLLPSSAQPYSSKEELLAEVRGFIHRYADLSEAFEEVATYYVLLTWIYDVFNELPYLRLKGDFGTGKSRCLLAIGSLCYKPMFASGASTVSPLFRIIDTFRGTLVMDEGDFRFSDERAEIVKILNNGNAIGFPVLRSEATPTKEFNPRAFTVFGPKIIASRSVFEDRALESRCITETMTGLPPRPDIPLSLPQSFHAEALKLRDKLLLFRFHTFRRGFDCNQRQYPEIEPRIAQVFAPLLAMVDDPAAAERLLGLARAASRTIQAERSATIEAQLLDIIAGLWDDAHPLGVKHIAEQFLERFGGDYRRPVTARWIGSQLRRRLSLIPVKSNGTFVIPLTEKPRLDSLFARYRTRDIGDGMGTSEGSNVAVVSPGEA